MASSIPFQLPVIAAAGQQRARESRGTKAAGGRSRSTTPPQIGGRRIEIPGGTPWRVSTVNLIGPGLLKPPAN